MVKAKSRHRRDLVRHAPRQQRAPRPALQVYLRFETLVAALIEDAVAVWGIRATAAELARTLMHAMRGLRDAAADAQDMRRLVTVQVDAFALAPVDGRRGR